MYSTYTGNTNSNNSPSTSVVNQTAGGSDPPPAFPGLASEYPGYDLAHNTVIDCRISNGGNFVSTLQCAQNLLGESWGRWAFKEFVGKGDRQFMESDLDEAERKCLSGITGFCATYQALLPFYQDDTQNPLAAAIGAAFVYRYFLRASVRSDPSRVRAALGEALPLNRRGMTYPQIPDPRTGQPIRFPDGRLAIVDRADRVHWGGVERRDFIKDWIDRGYDVPAGGWSKDDIHHIRPREYGGTNDFDNLVPVLRGEDGHVQFNRFWENW